MVAESGLMVPPDAGSREGASAPSGASPGATRVGLAEKSTTVLDRALCALLRIFHRLGEKNKLRLSTF